MDRLAAVQFDRAADVATQRYKATEMAMQNGDWKRATHLDLFCPTQSVSSPGERRTRAHHQGTSARDEAEKVFGRKPRSLAEGLGRQGQGPRKRQTSDNEKGRPNFKGQSEGKSSVKGKTSEEKPLQHREVGYPPVGACYPAPALDACFFEGEHASTSVAVVRGSGIAGYGLGWPRFSFFWELEMPSATRSSLVTWRMNSSLSQAPL